MVRKRAVGAAMLAVFAAVSGAALAQGADPIGVTSAVNPDARGTRPDGAQNVLMVGSNVIFKERIETGPGGQAQLLFNDQSAISVGPNATLVIDQFVYNPATGTGQMAVSLARGTARFVGGKISKQNEVTIATPAATIGIRGGVTMPTVADDGATRVVHIFGATTVRTPNGEATTLTRPGFVAEIAAPVPANVPANAPASTATPAQAAAPPPGGGISVRRASEAEISSTKSQLEAGPAQQSARAAAAPAPQAAAPQPQAQAQGQPQGQAQPQGPAPGQPATNAGGAPPPPPGGRIDGALGGSGFTGQNSGVAPNQIATVANTQPGFAPGPPPPGQQAAQAGAQANTTGAAQTGAVANVQQNLQSFASSLTFLGRARFGNWSSGPGTNLAAPVFDTADRSRTFSATIANGRFSGTLSNGETFGFNLPGDPLGRTFATGPGGTATPGGQMTGTTTFSADGRFTYGYYQLGSGERLATFSGASVSGSALADSSARVVREYRLSIDPALSGNIPFAPGMESGGNFANPAIGRFTTVTPTAGGQPGRALQVSFALDGSGTTQRSLLSVGTFNIANDSTGNLAVSGGVRGIYDLTGSQRPGRFGGSVASETDANGNSFFGSLAAGSAPSYFVLGQNDLNTSNVRIASDAYRNLVNNGAASDQYYRFSNVATFDRTVTTSTAPTTTFMNMYAAGLAERSGGTNVVRQEANDPTKSVLRFDAGNNTVTALLAVERVGAAETFKLAMGARPTTVTGAATSFTAQAADIVNSGFTTFAANGARSTLVDEKNWAAREMTNPGAGLDANGVSNFNAALVTSNLTDSPASVANEALRARMAMVPSTAIASSALAAAYSNVSFASFQSLQWGFWDGDVAFPNPLVTGGRTDRYSLATWVAGVLPIVGDIPSSGTATYTGHAIGTVNNNGARYSAAGSFTQTWNFGSDSGTVSISNFDGLATLTGSVTSANRRELTGSLSNGAGVTGNIAASFFRGTTDPVKNVGGNFNLTGTNYQAGGIVAGQR